jgi:hypothetical protein
MCTVHDDISDFWRPRQYPIVRGDERDGIGDPIRELRFNTFRAEIWPCLMFAAVHESVNGSTARPFLNLRFSGALRG